MRHRWAMALPVVLVVALVASFWLAPIALADSYDTQALTLSPLRYLAMSESAGPFGDLAASDSCTWHSALAHSSDGPGSAGGSGNFTNYSYCELGAAVSLGGAFTLVWWWRANTSGLPDNQPVYDGCVNSGDCTSELRVFVDVAGKPCFVYTGGLTACGSIASAWSDPASGWHMSAIAVDGVGDYAWYLDGAVDTYGTVGGGLPSLTSANGLIGARWANGDYLSLKLSRWELLGSQLSSGDVHTLYTYSAGPPVSAFQVSPVAMHTVAGSSATWSTTSSLGADTVASVTSAPSGLLTGCSFTSGSATCTVAGSAGDGGSLFWTDATGHTALTFLYIAGPGTRFELASTADTVPVGSTFQVYGSTFDASGVNTSASTTWSSTLPSGLTCSNYRHSAALGGSWAADCVASAAGAYTVTANESPDGFTGSVTVVVTGAPASGGTTPTCGTVSIGGTTWPDLGCWFHVLVDQVIGLPGAVAQAVSNWFFVSQSGKSYFDLSVAESAALPTVDCRSGQPSDDGIGDGKCFAFPVSIPFDFLGLLGSVADATPEPPVVPCHILLVYRGTTYLDVSFNVDATVVLTPTVMGWLKGVELVGFVLLVLFEAKQFYDWAEKAMPL